MIIKTIEYKKFLDLPDAVLRANRIAESTFKNPRSRRERSKEQIFKDSILGVAGEYALFDELQKRGLDVQWSPENDLSYDLSVRINGDILKIDVKVVRGVKNSYTVSPWETRSADTNTNYFYFDSSKNPAVFLGSANKTSFRESYS